MDKAMFDQQTKEYLDSKFQIFEEKLNAVIQTVNNNNSTVKESIDTLRSQSNEHYFNDKDHRKEVAKDFEQHKKDNDKSIEKLGERVGYLEQKQSNDELRFETIEKKAEGRRWSIELIIFAFLAAAGLLLQIIDKIVGQ